MDSDDDIVREAAFYIEHEPTDVFRSSIETLLSDQNGREKLKKAFKPRIAFGTAGLRARMDGGYAAINTLVVIQTTQGMLRYLQKIQHKQNNHQEQQQQQQQQQLRVVIGYDGRHHSRLFAENAAAVMLSQGVQVYFFHRCCTPLVPFAVKKFHAHAGIMITASHNPKQDNGYKVYWENGAQIIPPHDEEIQKSIMQQLKPWQKYEFDEVHPMLVNAEPEASDAYFAAIEQYSHYRNTNPRTTLKVTFTAMHGVGGMYTARALEVFKLPAYIPTPEQQEPDPDFPTVDYPNPEEGAGALKLAMRTADANNSPLILANDPDADRLAIAEKNLDGSWRIFNGNEIALLFADYIWHHYKLSGKSPGRAAMISSTVSSKAIKSMAHKEGFVYADTLTGFKWIANKAVDLIAQGYDFLFAYEVEIGFLVGSCSLDKDGVRTAAVFYELAAQLYFRGKNCAQQLEDIYSRYGYFSMTASYFFCYDKAIMAKIFDRIRSLGPNGSYPQRCGEFEILSTRDVTNGVDTGETDGKSRLPTDKGSQMLTFSFANGASATMRSSGTEPKLKFYVESSAATQADADGLTKRIVQALIDEFIQPQVFALKAKC